MQEPLETRHRYDPFGPDLHSWRESTGSVEAVQGVGVQAQPLGCVADRDEIGNQCLRRWGGAHDWPRMISSTYR